MHKFNIFMNFMLDKYTGVIVCLAQQIEQRNAQEENTMRKIKITAANKKHFDSLIRDFRNNGFMLVTYGRRLAELETETEFVIIEY